MKQPPFESPHFDSHRHPALFQRVSQSIPSAATSVEPLTQNIYAAFAQFAQFRPADHQYRGIYGSSAASEVWDYFNSLGFHPADIQQMHLGIYTTPEEVRDFLHGAGFSVEAILDSGLVTDANGAFRRDWQGGLIVPLEDEHGRICDVLAVIPVSVSGQSVRREFARGPVQTEAIAYGLCGAFATSAGRQNLVLVEDILEALYLQSRGFTNVAAVGGNGREFTARRWEELARLGVEAVTLAFGNDASRQRDVREALDQALRARSTPEVFVLERSHLLENETLGDVARRHGLEACRNAASVKSLAFHGKNFGWSWKREPAPVNGHKTPIGFVREDCRRKLWADSERIAHPYERAAIQQTITEVDEALYHRHYGHARAVTETRLADPRRHPPYPEARTTDVNAILDRLCEEKTHAAVPDHLSRYDGNELQGGTVTVLANESVRGRLADLCSRLVTALETRGEETWIVVCREFSEEVIVLGLIAHMTRRMTTAQGLTFEEILARLSGRDPKDGYGDKPWLVDEALDRLRRWTSRLKFVNETVASPYASHFIECVAEKQTLGGVFFDSLPSARRFDPTGSYTWQHASTSMEALRDLAVRLSCAVVAATDSVIAAGKPETVDCAPINGFAYHASPVVREFRERIAGWIDQAEREEVRIA